MKNLRRIILLVTSIFILSTTVTYGIDFDNQIHQCQLNKQSVHQIAEIARQLGYNEENLIIIEASRMWWIYNDEELGYIKSKSEQEDGLNKFLFENSQNAKDMAGVMYAESRGLSAYEMSMICWCILNRYDTQRYGKTLHSVIWAKSQFAHSTRTVSDNGTDLIWLANDVLTRWYREQQGETEVGRTLPQGYCFYYGDGYHNNFRMKNSGKGYHNFGLWNPYE